MNWRQSERVKFYVSLLFAADRLSGRDAGGFLYVFVIRAHGLVAGQAAAVWRLVGAFAGPWLMSKLDRQKVNRYLRPLVAVINLVLATLILMK